MAVVTTPRAVTDQNPNFGLSSVCVGDTYSLATVLSVAATYSVATYSLATYSVTETCWGCVDDGVGLGSWIVLAVMVGRPLVENVMRVDF